MDSPEGLDHAQGTQSPKDKFLIRQSLASALVDPMEMPEVPCIVRNWARWPQRVYDSVLTFLQGRVEVSTMVA